MRALVTGCAGFIGSHLTESLLEDGHDVLGVDCFNNNYARSQKLRHLERAYEWDSFAFVPVDLARGDIQDLVDEAEVIFHLAAEPGVRPSWGQRFEQYLRNNVIATQHLLEALTTQDRGQRFVYASSSSIYGQAEMFPTREDVVPAPHSPYGVTKLAGEHLCRLYASNHGVDSVALRYFSVYGPRQRPDMAFRRFCSAILDGGVIEVFGDGHQTRDFTYVDDVVAATRAAAERPGLAGRAINVGGGSRTTLRDTIMTLGELSGRPLEVEYGAMSSGDVRDTSADVSLATKLLDYAPATTLETGLERQWLWAVADRDRATARRG